MEIRKFSEEEITAIYDVAKKKVEAIERYYATEAPEDNKYDNLTRQTWNIIRQKCKLELDKKMEKTKGKGYALE